MEDFCGSPFWNSSSVENRTYLDVTPCFQDTVLTWLPFVYMALLTPLYALYLWGREADGRIRNNGLNITKTILSALYSLIVYTQLYDAVIRHERGDVIYPVHYTSPILLVIASVLATVTIQLERRHGQRISGVLCVFWVFVFLRDVTAVRTISIRIITQYDPLSVSEVTLTYMSGVIATILLLLFLFCVDEAPPGAEAREKGAWPVFNASVVSRLSFAWCLSLLVGAYKVKLSLNELWNLPSFYRCFVVNAPLQRCWTRQLRSKVVKINPDSMKSENMKHNDSSMRQSRDHASLEKASFFTAILQSQAREFIVSIALKLLTELLIFTTPQLLRLLLVAVRNPSELSENCYILAFAIFFVSQTQSIIAAQYTALQLVTGMKIRTAVMAAVYRKSLRISPSARLKSTIGEIVNLMAVDAHRYTEVMVFINAAWVSPFQVALGLYFLWGLLGASVLAGFAALLVVIPINLLIIRATKQLETTYMKKKDARMKLMNEVLTGIKVLKLYAWETSFEKKLTEIRNQELTTLKKTKVLSTISMFVSTISPILVALLSFAVYVLSSSDHVLDAEKAFVSVSLFEIMRSPLVALPAQFNQMIQLSVSNTRLATFLKRDELDFSQIDRTTKTEFSVSIKNGSFSWDPEAPPCLKTINMNVKAGSLVAVVGPVGCGKSSLLSALLGEMETLSGQTLINGSIAYVSQQPWIQHATMKDNILFDSPHQHQFYEQVVADCGLRPDLKVLPLADMTEIGERGINLSGGQKLRVSLARAVYTMADIFLLDDPLSAVDVHVGKHIFSRMLGPNGLLKDKTRILVTHAVSILPQVDLIIVMNEGVISEIGSFRSLLSHAGPFAEFLANHYLTGENQDEAGELNIKEEIVEYLSDLKPEWKRSFDSLNTESVDHRCRSSSDAAFQRGKPPSDKKTQSWFSDSCITTSVVNSRHIQHENLADGIPAFHDEPEFDSLDICSSLENGIVEQLRDETEAKVANDDKKCPDENQPLVKEEFMASGKVKLDVYFTYFRAIGRWRCLLFILLTVVHIGFRMTSTLWLADWTKDSRHFPDNTTAVDMRIDTHLSLRDYRLVVYGTLGFLEALFASLAYGSGQFACLRTGRLQHESMLHNLLEAGMVFFDSTPVGRSLNRFGSDVTSMDTTLPRLVLNITNYVFTIVGAVVLVTIVTPWALPVWIILGIIYMLIRRLHVTITRQLHRLISVNRSPIYAHFSETLSGVSTIRAYRHQTQFCTQSDLRLDRYKTCMYTHFMINRITSLFLETMGNSLVLVAACLATSSRHTLDAGFIGMSITSALSVTQTLGMVVRQSAAVENEIISMERIKEYIETPPEADRIIKNNRPGKDWPSSGSVRFNNYSTRYRAGQNLVVKELTVNIKGGEKVGIVGRTGAGKSSLTQGLFRIIEAAEGSITIDGLDVSKIGLYDLRSRLTIIPQDPVLFSGSLRMNLDPFEEYPDERLWQVLEQAHLKQFILTLDGGLQFQFSEGGQNLSVGQRQLICLARALLRHTRVLVLDEATAAVDLQTDELIQATIRAVFADCTVLTIAHRLNTILDYTKIMVMDSGRVIEYDTPGNLLNDKNSVFYGMVKESSGAEAH